MTMNIYITEDNEMWLRAHTGSMSGLINQLVKQHREKMDVAFESTPKGKNPFAGLVPASSLNSEPEATDEDISNMFVEPDGAPNRHYAGFHCCTLKKPCKHWAWDGVSLCWVNELTGETRDASEVI